jgi:hypothetical protein
MKASAWAGGISRARRGSRAVPWSGFFGRAGLVGMAGFATILAYLA